MENVKKMKLTAKQEAFAQAIADGMNQSEAYRLAYDINKMSDKTVWENASRLHSKLEARINELKAKLQSKQLWTREQSVKIIVQKIQQHLNDESPASATVCLNGVKILNEMHGFNAPIDLNVNTFAGATLQIVVNANDEIDCDESD